MGESRTELIAWLNELLQLNYNKVEQCGAGAAYCQVIDSIYCDLPMSRVKFNAKHEYEYISNLKILQNVFKAKKIDKPIPIERLVKCKMQDNLEFLQWMKKFWDANYPGHEYDPVARRRGAPVDTPATIAPLGASARGITPSSGGHPARGKTPIGGKRPGSAQSNEALHHLQVQMKEMQTHMEGLEKERDFYFNKLRDIEILAQAQMEALEAEGKTDETLGKIQEILYSTEEGFEVPEGEGVLDEEETF